MNERTVTRLYLVIQNGTQAYPWGTASFHVFSCSGLYYVHVTCTWCLGIELPEIDSTLT